MERLRSLEGQTIRVCGEMAHVFGESQVILRSGDRLEILAP